MDNRNVFVAIALSMAVLLFWGAFFETPRQVKENQTLNNVQTNQNETQSDITPIRSQILLIDSNDVTVTAAPDQIEATGTVVSDTSTTTAAGGAAGELAELLAG